MGARVRHNVSVERRFWLIVACLATLVGCGGKEDTDQTVDPVETGPSQQELLCEGYPTDRTCPTLPASPKLDDGTDFSGWEPSQCPSGAIPDLGRSGCRALGTTCPEGLWPADLPTDHIRFVTPGGTGDGRTRDNAAGSIQAMLDSTGPLSGATPNGFTIALSKGTFNETIEISKRQHVVGACARETILNGASTSVSQIVDITGSGESSVRDITITGSSVGIWVWNAASMVTIDGVNIDAATSAGLLVDDSVVEATGIRIGATQLNSRGATGRGVECSGGAQLTLEDAYLTGNHEASLNVTDEGTALSVRRTIIADTRGIDAGTAGRALRTQEGARTVLEQVWVSGSRETALYATGGSTELELTDVVVRATTPNDRGNGGWGISIQAGAKLQASRVSVSGSTEGGVVVMDAGTEATLTDVQVGETELWLDGGGGNALDLSKGAQATLSRVAFRDNYGTGLSVRDSGTVLTAQDLVVHGTRSDAIGVGGWGLNLSDGAKTNLTRALFSANRMVGILMFRDAPELVATDLVVEKTQVALCEEDASMTCPYTGAGQGDAVQVLGDGRLEVDGFTFRDNARVALYLFDTSDTELSLNLDYLITGAPEADLFRGSILNNAYGINFREGSYTAADFGGREIACYDNVSTVDGCYSNLPLEVPDPDDALGSVGALDGD